MAEQKPMAAPVRGKERIDFVDILRGFAVLGILVVNMYSFAGVRNGNFNLGWTSDLDRLIIVLSEFLIRAKFYTLFSFMFGWGMGLQMLRAQEKGVRFVPLYLRRLFILLLIGFIHGVFIWSGDILTLYALLGFVLLLFRNQPPRRLLIIGAIMLMWPIISFMPWEFIESFRANYIEFLNSIRVATGDTGGFASGSYSEITTSRANGFIFAAGNILFIFGNILPIFLLGLYVAKRRIFERVEENLPLIRRVFVGGLIVGVIFNGLFITFQLLAANNNWPGWLPVEYRTVLTNGSRTIGAPAMALFYASAFILLTRREGLHEWLNGTLGMVGRMALTNYLMHSIILTLVFYGYGLGLYGSITPTTALLITIALFYIQIRYSRWWFEQYQYGPFEWLWRTLTYGRRQPWRRGETYADVKPIPILSTRAAQIVIGVVLIAGLCFGLYSFGASQVEEEGGLALPGFGSDPTPTPEAEETAAEEGEGFIYIPPDVSPVAYNPGPLAAAGDLAALAEQFDVERILADIETLTGSPYNGRLAGTPGGWAAGDYIAQQMEAAGLQPVGDDGTYFQSFPINTSSLAAIPTLAISGPNGTNENYDLYQDYTPLVRGYMGEGAVSGEVVWANNCEHGDFNDLDVVDKIVFCRAVSLNLAPRQAVEHDAAGLLLLVDPEGRPLDLGIPYGETWLPEGLTIPSFLVSNDVAEDLLAGSGLGLNELSLSFESFPLATEVQLAVDTQTAESCTNQTCLGRNVLGVIPGRDPEYADEVVIVGGHYDHIGQGPDGTTWAGANDNASGTAVMLEIARVWQEQGYVPRRTVLFAAWDAEEMGLLGSVYYVNHPTYLRQDTVAVINLDMVGAGGDTLYVDSNSSLGGDLHQIATASGVISTTLTGIGGSDHVAFQKADVPATMLIWFGQSSDVPSYHKPADTLAVIEPEKLEIISRVAGRALLSLTEGEMALQTVAEERTAAVLAGDKDQFLASTAPDWLGLDELWFEDIQSYEPITFEMRLTNPLVVGYDAYADVDYEMSYLTVNEDGETITRTLEADMPGHFVWNEERWRWAGGRLEAAETNTGGLTVWLPVSSELQAAKIAAFAQDRYQDITGQLGLIQEAGGSLRLYQSSEHIRAETGLSIGTSTDTWVGLDTLKLTYSNAITGTERFQNGLVQLVLSDAGLTEAAAPWLWRGLAPALASAENPIEAQRGYLPELSSLLRTEEVPSSMADSVALDWAAVNYVWERLGWQGLGDLIVAMGEACQSRCEDPSAINAALQSRLGLDSKGLEAAWQASFLTELETTETAINTLLERRMNAVSEGNKAAFLATVDDSVPGLPAEQEHWFDDLSLYPTEALTLTGRPVVIYDDGRVLAEVDITYALAGLGDSSWAADEMTIEVLLTPDEAGGGLRWAGVPLERLPGQFVDVYYPAGGLKAAELFQAEAEALYIELASDFGLEVAVPEPAVVSGTETISSTDTITDTETATTTEVVSNTAPAQLAPVALKLYQSQNAFRQSIFLSFPLVDWLPAWTAPDEGVKLPIQGDLVAIQAITNTAGVEPYRATLSTYIARNILYDMGVETEWLVKGLAAYETGRLTGISPASDLRGLLTVINNEALPPLNQLSPDHRLDEDGFEDATVQSWDIIRFMAENYGFEALTEIVDHASQGMTAEAAVAAATGQSLADIEADWLASVSQAHIQPEWVTVAESFDIGQAEAHMNALTAPEMNGRQVGSPGSELAANYIAEKFEAYGLEPIGPDNSYFQPFDIDYVAWESAPVVEVSTSEGDVISLRFRQEFVLPVTITQSSEVVAGDLVYVFDETYEGLDLTGKVAVRVGDGSVEEEAAKAFEHGAAGLIMATNLDFEKDIVIKRPLPIQISETLTIPVVMLTRTGFDLLLESAGWTRTDINNSPPARPMGVTVRIQLPLSEPETVEVANVLGLLPGSDPILRDEYVILGAHYDHVGDDPDLLLCDGMFVAEAADFDETNPACERLPGLSYTGLVDNASGVAALLEVARLWQEMGYQPRRSVIFAAWTGQEAGQVGSQYYIENPVVPLAQTVSAIQLDTVGGGAAFRLEGQGIWEIDGILMLPMDLGSDLLDVRIKISTPDEIPNDDLPFRTAGIPALFLTWQDASEDNWPDHLVDEYDPDFMYVSGRVLTLVLMTAAG